MKGLSELISSVLLLVITIAIAVTLYAFFSNTVSSTTDKVSNKSTEAVDCTAAGINIDSVYLTNGTAGSARVIVRNTGFTNVMLNSAQLYNKTGYNFSASGVPLTFLRGQIATLTFANLSVQACTDFSRVIVTTSCGTSDVFDGTPSCA